MVREVRVRIVNFERYQHYKDRRPPWVKFYDDFRFDEKLADLRSSSRLLAALLLLVAADTGNLIPDSLEWLEIETSMPKREIKVGIGELLASGFLEPASESASKPASEVASEPASASRAPARSREAEAEAEAEKTRTLAPATPPRARDEVWDELERLFGQVAPKTNAHARRNKAAGDLRRQGASKGEIIAARMIWPRLFGDATCTDIALATHWPQLRELLGRRDKSRAKVCSECGMGGGFHVAGCAAVSPQDGAA